MECLKLCMSWTHFQLLPDLFLFFFFYHLFLLLELFFFLWEAQVMCLKYGNVSRVSAEAPIVVVVFAVLKP